MFLSHPRANPFASTLASTKPLKSSPLASSSSSPPPAVDPEPETEPDEDASSSMAPSSPTTSSFYQSALSAPSSTSSRTTRPISRTYKSRASTRSPSQSLVNAVLQRPKAARIVPPRDPNRNPFLDSQPGGMKGGEWEEYTQEEEDILAREVGRWARGDRKRREADGPSSDWEMGDLEEDEEPPSDLPELSQHPFEPDDLSLLPSLHSVPLLPSLASDSGDSLMSDGSIPPSTTIQEPERCPKCGNEGVELSEGLAMSCTRDTGCGWQVNQSTLSSLEDVWLAHLRESNDREDHRMVWYWDKYTGTLVLCSREGCEAEIALE